jgi:hypothetical protein
MLLAPARPLPKGLSSQISRRLLGTEILCKHHTRHSGDLRIAAARLESGGRLGMRNEKSGRIASAAAGYLRSACGLKWGTIVPSDQSVDVPDSIYGGPTKRLFVSMLTRDIELDDAILDLVDNSVDGAMRLNRGKVGSPSPFSGFEARLTVNATRFEISDNCGGIPPNYFEDAFSLGRPSTEKDKNLPTIGMYGIGMKRAIFKICKSARVASIHPESKLIVKYSNEWLAPENDNWTLPVEEFLGSTKRFGVTISSTDLKEDVGSQFKTEIFLSRLSTKISEHFGYIMQKGFRIWLNGLEVKPSTLPLLSSRFGKQPAIRAFDYRAILEGVHIEVTIGFFRPLVREKEIDEETLSATSAERAGISVVCNDRVVLLHDRSMKTGWGDGGVPRFHPQFRAIAGLIVLSSNNPLLLPISTTKRDLDVGSEIYLQTRQACIEGLKVFTSFTNRWKGMEQEANRFFADVEKRDARREIRLAVDHGVPVRGHPGAKKFKPNLPLPESRNPRKRISFVRDQAEIEDISAYLYQERSVAPSIIGEACFDRVLKEAR